MYRCKITLAFAQPYPYIRDTISRKLQPTEEVAKNERNFNNDALRILERRCNLRSRREANEGSKYTKLIEFFDKGIPLDSLVRRLRSHPSPVNLAKAHRLAQILEKEIDKESQSLRELIKEYHGGSKQSSPLTRLSRQSSATGEVLLETPDGRMTDVGVAVLNALFKKFLERAASLSLTDSLTDDQESNTLTVPGYLVLGNNRFTFGYEPHVLQTRRPNLVELTSPSQTEARRFNIQTKRNDISILPPLEIRLDDLKNTPENIELQVVTSETLAKNVSIEQIMPPHWSRYAKHKYSARAPGQTTPISATSPSAVFPKESEILINQKVCKPKSNKQKQKTKMTFPQKMSQAISHLRLINELKRKVVEERPHVNNFTTPKNVITAKLVLNSKWRTNKEKERKKRSDEKSSGNVIKLELKEILSTTEADEEDEEGVTAAKLALVIPDNWLIDSLTPRPSGKSRYGLRKMVGPKRVYSRARQHEGGFPYYLNMAPSAELVNLLLLLNKSNRSNVKNFAEEDYDGPPVYEEPSDYEDDDDEEAPLIELLGGPAAGEGVGFSGSIDMLDATTEPTKHKVSDSVVARTKAKEECEHKTERDEINATEDPVSKEEKKKCTSCMPPYQCTSTKHTIKCGNDKCSACVTNYVARGRCNICGLVTPSCVYCAKTSVTCSCCCKTTKSCFCASRSQTTHGCDCPSNTPSFMVPPEPAPTGCGTIRQASEVQVGSMSNVHEHLTSCPQLPTHIQPQLSSVVAKAMTRSPTKVNLSNVEIIIPRLNFKRKKKKYRVSNFPQVSLVKTKLGGVVQPRNPSHNRHKHKNRRTEGQYFGVVGDPNYAGSIKKGGMRYDYIPYRVLKLKDAGGTLPLKRPVLIETDQAHPIRTHQDLLAGHLNHRILQRILNQKGLDTTKHRDSRRKDQKEEYDEDENYAEENDD